MSKPLMSNSCHLCSYSWYYYLPNPSTIEAQQYQMIWVSTEKMHILPICMMVISSDSTIFMKVIERRHTLPACLFSQELGKSKFFMEVINFMFQGKLSNISFSLKYAPFPIQEYLILSVFTIYQMSSKARTIYTIRPLLDAAG